jgi:hypothetical protein
VFLRGWFRRTGFRRAFQSARLRRGPTAWVLVQPAPSWEPRPPRLSSLPLPLSEIASGPRTLNYADETIPCTTQEGSNMPVNSCRRSRCGCCNAASHAPVAARTTTRGEGGTVKSPDAATLLRMWTTQTIREATLEYNDFSNHTRCTKPDGRQPGAWRGVTCGLLAPRLCYQVLNMKRGPGLAMRCPALRAPTSSAQDTPYVATGTSIQFTFFSRR